MARSVDGIDVILSGHTHNRLDQPARVGETLIMQSGCHGSFVSELNLNIKAGRIVDFRHQLIPVDESVVPDPEMAMLAESAMSPYRAHLSQVIGKTDIALHRTENLQSSMDDVLLAAISHAADTTITFSNGWRYGAPIPPGPVTVNDIWNIIPTNPPVSTLMMTGAEIREMMEENLERTFSSDPFGQMGGYLKRFRGLTIYGKIENPAGHRIEHIFAKGSAIENDVDYHVPFVTEQGVPKEYGRARQDLSIDAISALQSYFRSPIQPRDSAWGVLSPHSQSFVILIQVRCLRRK